MKTINKKRNRSKHYKTKKSFRNKIRKTRKMLKGG